MKTHYVIENAHGMTRHYAGDIVQLNKTWTTWVKVASSNVPSFTQEEAQRRADALNEQHSDCKHFCTYGIQEVSQHGPNHAHSKPDSIVPCGRLPDRTSKATHAATRTTTD